MKESREERFRRVAEARVNKLIRMICLLGNCSNRSVYAYTPEQVDQIFDWLQAELNHARERYSSVRGRFTLDNQNNSEPCRAERQKHEYFQ